MTLAELKNKESAFITKVKGRGAFRRRIMEMGFVKGQKVSVIKNAPLRDPVEYRIMNYNISLRRSEASLIEVVPVNETGTDEELGSGAKYYDSIRHTGRNHGERNIHVALVGNPNSGKTTLYNQASHSHEHVGNYSGVTIDSKNTEFNYKGYQIKLTDLPGTYSLTDYTPEELYVRKYIIGEMPDIVVNVLDASNLERNLYLSTQLLDMDIRVILALNMYDELEKSGDKFDHESLGKMMGMPIVPTVASRGRGINELFDRIIDVFEDRDKSIRPVRVNYGVETERSIERIQELIQENRSISDRAAPRYYAVKMLEKDKSARFSLSHFENYNEIEKLTGKETERLKSISREEADNLITDARYGFIAGGLKETYSKNPEERAQTSEIIDTFLTHKLFGFPVLLFSLFITFYSTFEIGQYPMHWMDMLVQLFSGYLSTHLAPGPLTDLVVEGIVGGVGSVLVFLPNILILFFFISLMEDTGYMARAAFIMDRLMHKIGLHGRSFIPLVMGFGCNVPAIMATRIINNRNNRLLTILINPFMSCSARLPVYILIIGAFFPSSPGLVLFGLYSLGIAVAALVAILFKKTLFKTDETPFVMELPPYRIPTLRSSIEHMWTKGAEYLKKMGGVILIASVLIWGLGYFPRSSNGDMEKSYIGQIGHFVEPALSPLGFDWKMSVSLLTGVAAKEVVVSTLGVLYKDKGNKLADKATLNKSTGIEDEPVTESNQVLISNMKNAEYKTGAKTGEKVFSPLTGLSFLVFILLYFPCVAVVATISREAGSWKWAAFTVLYTTGLAWIMSFIIYQGGRLLGF